MSKSYTTSHPDCDDWLLWHEVPWQCLHAKVQEIPYFLQLHRWLEHPSPFHEHLITFNKVSGAGWLSVVSGIKMLFFFSQLHTILHPDQHPYTASFDGKRRKSEILLHLSWGAKPLAEQIMCWKGFFDGVLSAATYLKYHLSHLYKGPSIGIFSPAAAIRSLSCDFRCILQHIILSVHLPWAMKGLCRCVSYTSARWCRTP